MVPGWVHVVVQGEGPRGGPSGPLCTQAQRPQVDRKTLPQTKWKGGTTPAL